MSPSILSRLRSTRTRTKLLGAVTGVAALAASGVVVAASAAGVATHHSTTASASCASARQFSKPLLRTASGKGIAIGSRPSLAGARACAVGSAVPKHGAGTTPPLFFLGGPVMGTSASQPITVTPIFWAPSGVSFTAQYKNLIVRYLQDVAKASATRKNVFATNTEYNGSNGAHHYLVKVGNPINDTTTPYSTGGSGGCTPSPGPVYSNSDGYTACVDDDAVTNEVNSQHATYDYQHIYVVFEPRQVESCALSDSQAVTAGGNACTINGTPGNPSPTAAYCAYHSFAFNSAVQNVHEIYAEMPFPIYNSPVGPTCGNEKNFHALESPNSNPDADVEISPLSHELSEAFTDPNAGKNPAWNDSSGFENGDDCAYTYGATGGPAGKFYNQTINGHHYLTQEEWSNAAFYATFGNVGCVQTESAPGTIAAKPAQGSHKGGTTVHLHGTRYTPTSEVFFGGTQAKVIKMPDWGDLIVKAPAHAAGVVKIVVKTIGGSSNPVSFKYK